MNAIKKTLLIAVAVVALLIAAVLAFAVYSGAWRVFFPSDAHDTVPPRLPASMESPAVLLFSKTNSFRHADGIEGGSRAIREIASRQGWQVFATENGAVFNELDLRQFDAVVFLNVSGDTLNTDQESAFQHWLEAGGGWLGIHAAGDGSHGEWAWYMDKLIGATFTAHIMGPQFQQASLHREQVDHPVVLRMPDTWTHTDEWYSWEASPRVNGFTILATIEETSYSPTVKLLWMEKDLRMGDHPVVWANCVGKGRSVYSAMGHSAESFTHAEHRRLLESALLWVIGNGGEGCP